MCMGSRPLISCMLKRCSLQKDWSTAGHTRIWASASSNLRLSTSCLKGVLKMPAAYHLEILRPPDLGEVASGHSLSLADVGAGYQLAVASKLRDNFMLPT